MDAMEGCAADGIRQTEPAQNRNAAWHEAFPTSLFPGECAAFEHSHGESLPAEQNGQSRARDPSTCYGYVKHIDAKSCSTLLCNLIRISAASFGARLGLLLDDTVSALSVWRLKVICVRVADQIGDGNSQKTTTLIS